MNTCHHRNLHVAYVQVNQKHSSVDLSANISTSVGFAAGILQRAATFSKIFIF